MRAPQQVAPPPSCVVPPVKRIYIFRVPSAEAVEASPATYISSRWRSPLSIARLLDEHGLDAAEHHARRPRAVRRTPLPPTTSTTTPPPPPHPLVQSLAQLRDESDMVGKIALSGKTGSPFASVRRGALRYANFWYRELDAWVRWDASRT